MKSEQILLTKRQCALRFLDSIIASEQFLPFFQFQEITFGFFDFEFITKCSNLSLKKLKQEVKTRKKFTNQWFIPEFKNIFIQISDYLLLNDPLQSLCILGLQKIINYEKNLTIFNKRIKQSQQNTKQCIFPKKKSLDFKRQLQMAFYLQNYENDQDLLRKIGEVCQIISQTQNQFIFDLSTSDLWLPLIERKTPD